MKDLSELNPNQEKINELQMQLNNLNNFIYLPKNMMKRDKDRRPYYADPNAYYDPTRSEITNKKIALENKINRMKANLRTMELEKRSVAAGEKTTNPFGYEKVQGKIYVENRENSKTEAYNEYVKNMLGEDENQNFKKNTITPPLRNSENLNDQKPKKTYILSSNIKPKTENLITFSTIASNFDSSNNLSTQKKLKNGKFLKIFINF
jgi:hypothetical protein